MRAIQLGKRRDRGRGFTLCRESSFRGRLPVDSGKARPVFRGSTAMIPLDAGQQSHESQIPGDRDRVLQPRTRAGSGLKHLCPSLAEELASSNATLNLHHASEAGK
jgi:hypothetical protein